MFPYLATFGGSATVPEHLSGEDSGARDKEDYFGIAPPLHSINGK